MWKPDMKKTKCLIPFVLLMLLFFVNNSVSAEGQQQLTVQGSVTDQEGNKIPGVSVIVKGTTIGTLTDANGNYSLNVPSKEDMLVFSLLECRLRR